MKTPTVVAYKVITKQPYVIMAKWNGLYAMGILKEIPKAIDLPDILRRLVFGASPEIGVYHYHETPYNYSATTDLQPPFNPKRDTTERDNALNAIIVDAAVEADIENAATSAILNMIRDVPISPTKLRMFAADMFEAGRNTDADFDDAYTYFLYSIGANIDTEECIMKITPIAPISEYHDILCRHILKQFPSRSHTIGDLLELLTDVFISTKDRRYGSIPPPESLVVMRTTIRKAIIANKPIPILIPWGSIKADFNSNIDIAELMALKQILTLQEEVSKLYEPGIDAVIRIEDTSGYELFKLEADYDTIYANSNEYSHDLARLITILGSDKGISYKLESDMCNHEKFTDTVKTYIPYFVDYLSTTHEYAHNPTKLMSTTEYRNLFSIGWKGYISKEQREHYYAAYSLLYNDWDMSKLQMRLAMYFAGALARHTLSMTGKRDWDNFIQISFVPPIKGLPEGYNSNYLYYRTVPCSDARTHIPPWRAKGYLQITGNEVKSKIASFITGIDISDDEMIVLAKDGLSVNVKVPYLVIS